MPDAAPYPSLADFAETWTQRDPSARAPFVLDMAAAPLAGLPDLGLRSRLEDMLETVVALQRADWLQDGVYIGPRSERDSYQVILDAARTLKVAVPPAILSAVAARSQGIFGTDRRAFMHLSSFFFRPASDGERRFVAGRLCGHVAAQQVTWITTYALLVDHNGIRQLARRNLGPTLEVVLAPLSFGARLALSRWHRVAEVNADRAGLLVCGDLDDAGRALLRTALGVRPDVTAEAYLDQVRGEDAASSPGRWAELLQSRPWMHKRLKALTLFARSEVYAELGGEAADGPLLTREELDRQTAALLQVV